MPPHVSCSARKCRACESSAVSGHMRSSPVASTLRRHCSSRSIPTSAACGPLPDGGSRCARLAGSCPLPLAAPPPPPLPFSPEGVPPREGGAAAAAAAAAAASWDGMGIAPVMGSGCHPSGQSSGLSSICTRYLPASRFRLGSSAWPASPLHSASTGYSWPQVTCSAVGTLHTRSRRGSVGCVEANSATCTGAKGVSTCRVRMHRALAVYSPPAICGLPTGASTTLAKG
mmetsp:Transcript_14433/g.39109  ORF Transcript_14433/g.39109 Transcript_14433/m.39109 type:complete len:229 (-) Transcript_14433:735-1421(-)